MVNERDGESQSRACASPTPSGSAQARDRVRLLPASRSCSLCSLPPHPRSGRALLYTPTSVTSYRHSLTHPLPAKPFQN